MMISHEWHSDSHPADRINDLERKLSIATEMEARLLIMIKDRDEKITRLEDEISRLAIDLNLRNG